MPSGFAIYGLHDENGTLKSETKFGHTTARITYDGTVEYESPTFYVRDGFKDQWWYCTHMRFDCTEFLSDNAESFRLAEFQICLYNEYNIGDGALLRNDGDIINAADTNRRKATGISRLSTKKATVAGMQMKMPGYGRVA